MKKMTPMIIQAVKRHPNGIVTWKVCDYWGRKSLNIYVNGYRLYYIILE